MKNRIIVTVTMLFSIELLSEKKQIQSVILR